MCGYRLEQIAHYRVKGKLGAGGMGEVYLATDQKLDRDVALKVLPDALLADPTARARLVREARTASALNHPNICHIYDVGEFAGHSYIAMEHVEGRPLSQSIPAEGLPLDTALRYAEQLAEALAHAHDRGVLHRDLKSANVMITPEGRVKVLDFGLAKRSAASPDEATRAIDSVTQAGSVAGTLHYLAPELLRGQPADARSDIWALGVTFYEMITGKLPFTGRTGFEASAAILRESPAPLPAHVPPGMRSIITRCLAKEPAQRYQRASELRAALEAIRSDSGAIAVAPTHAPVSSPASAAALTTPSPATQPSSTKESWSMLGIWLAWLLGLVILFAAFVAVIQWLSPSPQPASSQPSTAAPSPPALPEGPRRSLGGKPSPHAEANAYVEKAMIFFRTQFDLPRGRQMLEKALELDPQFAEARAYYALTHLFYIELGISNQSAWIYKAEEEVRRALRDDPASVQGKVTLGAVYFMQGKKELLRPLAEEALAADPNNLGALIWLSTYNRMIGDYPAAIAQGRRAQAVNPIFWANSLRIGQALHESGDAPAAIRMFGGVLEQDPENPYALRELARGHVETGDTKTARLFLDKVRPSDRQNYRVRLTRAILLAREGKWRDALREMDGELLKYAGLNPMYTSEAAEFYALLGDKTQALDWLEKAVRNGDERIEWFRRNPLLESIRNEFRFKSLLDSIAFRRQQKNP